MFELYKLIQKQRDLSNLEIVICIASQTQVSHLFPTFHLFFHHKTAITLSIVWLETK